MIQETKNIRVTARDRIDFRTLRYHQHVRNTIRKQEAIKKKTTEDSMIQHYINLLIDDILRALLLSNE